MLKTLRYSFDLLTPRHRRQMPILLALALLSFLLEALSAIALFRLLYALNDGNATITADDALPLPDIFGFAETLQALVVAVLILYVLKNGIRAITLYGYERFAEDVTVQWAMQLYDRYMAAPYTFHLRRNSATLIRNLKQTDQACRGVLLTFLALVSECIVIGAVALILIRSTPLAALWALGFIIIMLLIALLVGRRLQARWGEHFHETSHDFYKTLQEGLEFFKEIMVFQRFHFFRKSHQEVRLRLGSLVRIRSLMETWPAIALEVFLVLAICGLVLWLYSPTTGPTDLLPLLGMFAYAGFRILPAVNKILVCIIGIRTAAPLMKDIHAELLHTSIPVRPAPSALPLTFEKAITLSNFSFHYPEHEQAGLFALSTMLHAGESTAIVGKTGAGKTTLLHALLGIFPPTEGEICIDNRNLYEHVPSWHAMLGYVPQQPILLDSTIAANIAFGHSEDEIDTTHLQHVIAQAQLAPWIQTLPEGLNTVVGERGIRVSGGQRQRIAIARALYHQPQVLLFDEPSSALDFQTERALETALQDQAGTLTRIVVTHRIETARLCDRILFLAEGHLVAHGTFDVLYASNKEFRTFVQTAFAHKAPL